MTKVGEKYLNNSNNATVIIDEIDKDGWVHLHIDGESKSYTNSDMFDPEKWESLLQRRAYTPVNEYGKGGPITAVITKEDVTAGSRFKTYKGTVFVVDSLEEDPKFGTLVSSSYDGGKKGRYKDAIDDFVVFLNEMGCVKIMESGGVIGENWVHSSEEDMNEYTLSIKKQIEDYGYYVSPPNYSKTDFGNSNYLSVALTGSEEDYPYRVKVRISDHGVTNRDRMANEIHLHYPQTNGLLGINYVIKELDYKLNRSKYFEEKDDFEKTYANMEIPEHLLRPTDKIISERESSGRRGPKRKIFNIERTGIIPVKNWIHTRFENKKQMAKGGKIKNNNNNTVFTKDGIKVEKGTQKYKGHVFFDEKGGKYTCMGYFPKLDDCVYMDEQAKTEVVGCMDGFYYNDPTSTPDIDCAIKEVYDTDKIIADAKARKLKKI